MIRFSNLLGIDEKASVQDVDEDRLRADVADRFRSRDERVRHGDDFVSRGNARCPQRESEGVGAVADADRVLHPDERRELLFEGGDLFTQDERRRLKHACDRGIDLGGERLVLCFEIDEGDLHGLLPEKGVGYAGRPVSG